MSHLAQVPNSPSPLSPTSHCLCPASITCNLSSYNTLPWGMLALGVICSLCCYRRALPKMQTYPHHCPAYRTTVVHTGHQDKNLSGGCPIHSSTSPPFAESLVSKLTILLLSQHSEDWGLCRSLKHTSLWQQSTRTLDDKIISSSREEGNFICLDFLIYALGAFLNPPKTYSLWPYSRASFRCGSLEGFILVLRI